jgi:hypothetical protein
MEEILRQSEAEAARKNMQNAEAVAWAQSIRNRHDVLELRICIGRAEEAYTPVDTHGQKRVLTNHPCRLSIAENICLAKLQ